MAESIACFECDHLSPQMTIQLQLLDKKQEF